MIDIDKTEKGANIFIKLMNWAKRYIKEPEGIILLIFVVLSIFLYALYKHGENRYKNGEENGKATQSYTITTQEKVIAELKLALIQKESEKKKLQARIDSTDCAEQTRKSIETVKALEKALSGMVQEKIERNQSIKKVKNELQEFTINIKNSTK